MTGKRGRSLQSELFVTYVGSRRWLDCHLAVGPSAAEAEVMHAPGAKHHPQAQGCQIQCGSRHLSGSSVRSLEVDHSSSCLCTFPHKAQLGSTTVSRQSMYRLALTVRSCWVHAPGSLGRELVSWDGGVEGCLERGVMQAAPVLGPLSHQKVPRAEDVVHVHLQGQGQGKACSMLALSVANGCSREFCIR